MNEPTHELTTLTDDEGWGLAQCSCGWVSPPSSDRDVALHFWHEHLAFASRIDANMAKYSKILNRLRTEGTRQR